jgi:hypothetical protein
LRTTVEQWTTFEHWTATHCSTAVLSRFLAELARRV